ncbi:hypothetical protein D3C80_2003260 [compost metagenome]
MYQIHRTAHCGHAFGANTPIGEITVLGNLIGAENRDIEMSAAHHRETIGMMEKCRAGL